MGITEVGLFTSIGVNFVTLYAAFRKEKTAARKADAEADAAVARQEADIEDRVIARWQAYAAEREAAGVRESARLGGVIEQMRSELEAARKDRSECREHSARQEERIEHMSGDLKALKAALKAAGIRPGSGDHEPLKG